MKDNNQSCLTIGPGRALFSNDLSSNPDEVYSFYSEKLFEMNENKKGTGDGPF